MITKTHRSVWALAGPMLVTNLSIPLLGFVDTAVLGHLDGPTDLAAVAVATAILSFVYWGFGFLRMGTTGLTANAFGANDTGQLSRLIMQGLCLALIISTLILLSQWLWRAPAISAMGANSATSAIANNYLAIRLFSMPAVLATYVAVGWLLGIGNAKATLVIAVATNLLNILGDLLFVLVLEWGAEGAALASVIAEYVGAVIAVSYLLHYRRKLQLTKPKNWLAGWRQLIQANSALFVRTLALLFAIAFFTSQGARLGELTLAANAILYQLVAASAFALDAFAHATESLAGRFIGRKDQRAFRTHTGAALVWALVCALIISLMYYLAGSEILDLFTQQADILAVANEALPWVVLIPLVSILSYQLDGLYIGAGEYAAMRNIMVVSVIIYLSVWYVSQSWGNDGLWLAFIALNASRSALMTGHWLRARQRWFG
ncbi:MAG: MATE family efflux transporter [Pseudomonadales bacterium]